MGHLLAARARDVLKRPADTSTSAFEKFWLPHRPRVWRLVARLAGNVDLADDLTQEVSLRAFQAFGTFRGGSGGYTWLYRIAVNVVLRHREQAPLPNLPLDHGAVITLPTSSQTGPEAAALGRELRERVWAALDRLPEEARAAVILQVYEQLKYREIAEVLNIPIGTVKSRLHTAMARLREELKNEL